MALAETVGRIGNVEFLAVMPSGLFVFGGAFAVFTFDPTVDTSLWAAAMRMATTLVATPAVILVVLFSAYLFGSILRTLPVRWVDFMPQSRNDPFPYRGHLQEVLDQLKKQRDAAQVDPSRFPQLDASLTSAAFNYWKDLLCMQAPNAFQYYQTFEARSRFFAGMFWAGVIGLFEAITFFARSGTGASPAWQLLVLSIVIIAAFGFQLPRVRRQEASVLMTCIVALRQAHNAD